MENNKVDLNKEEWNIIKFNNLLILDILKELTIIYDYYHRQSNGLNKLID